MILADVSITDKFDYDGDNCYRLYIDYVACTIEADHFITYLRRYVILRVRKFYYKKLGPDVCEDLVQASLLELWKLVRAKKLPQDGTGVFHSFLNTVIRRKIAKTFKEVYDDAPKKLNAHRFARVLYRRIPSADSVELKVFLEEIPDLLREKILGHLPFPEENRRRACACVLNCILSKQRVVPARIKREFKVRDPDFLVEHVKISVRQHLYEMRKDVTLPSDAEKREILHEGIEECFGI